MEFVGSCIVGSCGFMVSYVPVVSLNHDVVGFCDFVGLSCRRFLRFPCRSSGFLGL